MRDDEAVSSERLSQVLRDFGRRVAELRVARGLTQAELGEQIGIATNHLQQIENGKLNLTIRSIVRLADHFGLDIGALFVPPETREVRRGRPPKSKPSAT